MREPRNPFRLRASEAIESDTTFLKLFGPGMLDLLPSGQHLWDKPQVFRSAPGAGKSSLLRLFTPTVLLTLHAFRRNDEQRDSSVRKHIFNEQHGRGFASVGNAARRSSL